MLAIRNSSRYWLLVGSLFLCSSASAHFPWLIRQPDGKVQFFFGEGLQDCTYKLPPSVAQAKIFALPSGESSELIPVTVSAIESDSFMGLQGEPDLAADATLISQVTFGIYHGSKLQYTSLHHGSPLKRARTAEPSRKSVGPLFLEIIQTDSGIDAFLSWENAPLVECDVHLYGSDGEKTATVKTDEAGRVSFKGADLSSGINGLMAGYQVKEGGEWQGSKYESQSYYLTTTFMGGSIENTETLLSTELPLLPLEVTSFGACRQAESIYVYGGHMGSAHSYSKAGQNNKLLKLDLANLERGWQEIATNKPLQGLGMVAHGAHVILVGGFTAMNEEGEPHDLHSQTNVVAFNTKTNQWQDLPSLPEGRSSHDAALIGDILYIAGGWNMSGPEKTTWHTTALAMDLSSATPTWTLLPEPPFVRRAIATIAHEGKLFVIGGMNETGGPTRAVAIYDPQQNQWTEAAEIKGESGMAGFGAAGWSLNGHLIVNTYEGSIQQWNHKSQTWDVLGQSEDARFFHRILPLNQEKLISIGGANMDQGKFNHIEIIDVN